MVAPTDIVSSEWPAVRKTCVVKMGVGFDDWQDGLGRLTLAKRADGNLAAMIDGVGVSVCRQVGKTYTFGALLFGLCINKPGLLVIWSAHHARTHAETFLAMQAFAQRPKVAPHVRQIFTGSGDEEIRFHNGSRILFGARERGFGRGIPGVDAMVFDEAQILSDKALANMLATLNTSKFGLQLYIGTPPKPGDMSEAFTRMRRSALDGQLIDGAWVELGADEDAAPSDRKQWAKANPSYPVRTPAQSILRLQRKLTPEDFLREGLGIWGDGDADALIDLAVWAEGLDESSEIAGTPVLAVDVPLDRTSASIGAAGLREDALTHVELVTQRRGTDWVPSAVIALAKTHQAAVVIDHGSPAASFIDQIRDGGAFVIEAATRDIAAASGQMFDAINQRRVKHGPQPDLDAAIAGAKKRPLGEAWAFGRRHSTSNISPLMAVTLAAWGLQADVEVLNTIW